jgi:hypothetical protein
VSTLGENLRQHGGKRSERSRHLDREVEGGAEVGLRLAKLAALQPDPPAHADHQRVAADEPTPARVGETALDVGGRGIETPGANEIGDDARLRRGRRQRACRQATLDERGGMGVVGCRLGSRHVRRGRENESLAARFPGQSRCQTLKALDLVTVDAEIHANALCQDRLQHERELAILLAEAGQSVAGDDCRLGCPHPVVEAVRQLERNPRPLDAVPDQRQGLVEAVRTFGQRGQELGRAELGQHPDTKLRCRRLGERTAQVFHGELRRALARRLPRGGPQQLHHPRVGCGRGVQQVCGDRPGRRVTAGEEAGGFAMSQGPLDRRHSFLDRSPHDRVPKPQGDAVGEHVGGGERRSDGGCIPRVDAGERRSCLGRRAVAEHGHRTGESLRCEWHGLEPAQDAARRALGPHALEPVRGRRVRRGSTLGELREQLAKEQRVPSGQLPAGACESGFRCLLEQGGRQRRDGSLGQSGRANRVGNESLHERALLPREGRAKRQRQRDR